VPAGYFPTWGLLARIVHSGALSNKRGGHERTNHERHFRQRIWDHSADVVKKKQVIGRAERVFTLLTRKGWHDSFAFAGSKPLLSASGFLHAIACQLIYRVCLYA